MKKLLFLLLLCIPIKYIDAKCLYSDLAELKKTASNVNESYEYKIIDNKAYFDVTLTNLTDDIYFVDTTNNKVYKNNNSEITLKDYNSGQTIVYNFYSSNLDCQDTVLYTIRIVLPQYNIFYNDPVCDGAKEYSLCQRWYGNNLSYNTFLDKVNQYKENKKENDNNLEIEPEEVGNNNLLHYVINFLTNYYYVILIIFCGIFIIVSYIRNKKNNIYN